MRRPKAGASALSQRRDDKDKGSAESRFRKSQSLRIPLFVLAQTSDSREGFELQDCARGETRMWPLRLRGPARQRMLGSAADWPGSSRTDLGYEEHRDLSTRRIPQRTDKQLAHVHWGSIATAPGLTT